jgi:hypothetical protein
MFPNRVYLGPFLALGQCTAMFFGVYFQLRTVVSSRGNRLGAMGIEMLIDLGVEMVEIVA